MIKTETKDTKLINIESHLRGLEHNYGHTDKAWLKAYDYLDNNHIDTYYLTAIGIDSGANAKEWFKSYYVLDENAGPKVAKHIKRQLPNVDDHKVYRSNQGLDAYNWGMSVPESIQKARPGDIEESFKQMIQSLHDFPEKY